MILAALLVLLAPPTAAAQDAELLLSAAAPDRDPFVPTNVVRVPNGPRLVELDASGSDVVAIRVSVPVLEGAREAGAARLLQTLGLERAQPRAALIGALLEAARTPWGITYTVAGAQGDFDTLVEILRTALDEPTIRDVDFERHRLALHNEMLRLAEVPAARVGAELRTRAAPDLPPLDGSPATIDRITGVTVRDLWTRTHRPAEMTVVVAGEISRERLLAAFRGLGATRGSAERPPTGSAPPAGRQDTQVFRHWYGEAYRIADPLDPHARVAALLAAARFREAGYRFDYASVELWELPGAQVIATVAAEYTAGARAMRQGFPGLLIETRQSLDDGDVEAAVRLVRQDVLERARSPVGLVGVVGRWLDAGGDADSAREYLSALERVTPESMEAFLEALERQSPLRVEVRP